jgi:hypothetical protein
MATGHGLSLCAIDHRTWNLVTERLGETPVQPDYETPACFVADRAGAHPEFDFAWLRKESPEKYESYVDMEAGAWTKYRIVVDGTKARLFVMRQCGPA